MREIRHIFTAAAVAAVLAAGAAVPAQAAHPAAKKAPKVKVCKKKRGVKLSRKCKRVAPVRAGQVDQYYENAYAVMRGPRTAEDELRADLYWFFTPGRLGLDVPFATANRDLSRRVHLQLPPPFDQYEFWVVPTVDTLCLVWTVDAHRYSPGGCGNNGRQWPILGANGLLDMKWNTMFLFGLLPDSVTAAAIRQAGADTPAPLTDNAWAGAFNMCDGGVSLIDQAGGVLQTFDVGCARPW